MVDTVLTSQETYDKMVDMLAQMILDYQSLAAHRRITERISELIEIELEEEAAELAERELLAEYFGTNEFKRVA